MNIEEITKKAKLILLITVLVGGISFASAQIPGWQEPTSAPPTGNVAPPINTSIVSQEKNGNLTVSGLGVLNNIAQFGDVLLAQDGGKSVTIGNSSSSIGSNLSVTGSVNSGSYVHGSTLKASNIAGVQTPLCADSDGTVISCAVSSAPALRFPIIDQVREEIAGNSGFASCDDATHHEGYEPPVLIGGGLDKVQGMSYYLITDNYPDLQHNRWLGECNKLTPSHRCFIYALCASWPSYEDAGPGAVNLDLIGPNQLTFWDDGEECSYTADLHVNLAGGTNPYTYSWSVSPSSLSGASRLEIDLSPGGNRSSSILSIEWFKNDGLESIPDVTVTASVSDGNGHTSSDSVVYSNISIPANCQE